MIVKSVKNEIKSKIIINALYPRTGILSLSTAKDQGEGRIRD